MNSSRVNWGNWQPAGDVPPKLVRGTPIQMTLRCGSKVISTDSWVKQNLWGQVTMYRIMINPQVIRMREMIRSCLLTKGIVDEGPS